MPEIVVTVKNKMAVGDGSVIVCNNSDYVVRFALDSEWDALALRTMRIVYDSYSHTDIAFSGDTVALPTIIDRTSIGIGLYSGDIHTSTCAMFDCERSVMGKNSNAVAPPPSDVYNEIVGMINDGRLKGDKGADGTNGADGANGADGVTFTPSVDSAGNLSWTNDGGLSNPAPVNIKGATGATGERGEQGIPGEPGAKGDKGDKGDKGEPGADAPQDVVRYAVQSLTVEQQTQARVNIGAAEAFGVGDGLKMDGHVLSVKQGEYELIETFTLNEEGTVVRTKEPDGRNYNFIGCIALIHIGEVENDTAASIYMKNSKTDANIVRFSLGKALANYYGFAKTDKINNVWSCLGRMLTNDTMISANVFTSYNTLSLNEGSESVIDKIMIFNLPIGTTITIKGVRADA